MIPTIREMQEWLCLSGLPVAIDGIYGPATKAAILAFQKRVYLPITGQADDATFRAITAPLQAANQPIPSSGSSLSEMTALYAEQHLAQSPREVGGENCGPWVRLYMSGKEGDAYLWCAGFATYILRMAADTLGVVSPIPYKWGCSEIGVIARKKGILTTFTPSVKRGDLFLIPKGKASYQHIGIVRKIYTDHFTSIEGNSNINGSRNGVAVVSAIRSFTGKDFISIV